MVNIIRKAKIFRGKPFRVNSERMAEAIRIAIPLIKQLKIDSIHEAIFVHKLYKTRTGSLWQK